MDTTSDQPVTILGAGIVGICCALSLAARGVAVRVIDRDAPGQATSFGNAGVISPGSIIPMAQPGILRHLPGLLYGGDRPVAVRPSFWPRMLPWGLQFRRAATEPRLRAAADAMAHLCDPSIDLYRRHLAGTGHEGLVVDAYYIHAFRDADKATLDALDYRIRLEKGVDVARVDGAELRRIEPALSPAFTAAVLIRGQARARDPGLIGTVLADKARGMGVEFLRAEIRRLRPAAPQGWRIETSAGPVEAARVVMAMGAWSAAVLAGAGIRVPLVAERGYHVQFADPGVSLTHTVMDAQAKFAMASMREGLRAAGHTEFAAVDAPADPRRHARLAAQARRALPDLAPGQPSLWLGRRPSFPDGLPMLGPFAGRPGLFAAFGHSHHGLMMAPKTGEVIADLLTEGRGNADLSAFATGRFGG